MKKVSFLIFLFAGLSLQATAQTLPFRTYSIENGLSEAVVNNMMQGSEGYIWIATGYGLNRFDGIRFKNYYEEDGLLNNRIHALYEDTEGTIWVGTGGGVNTMIGDSIAAPAALKPLRSSTVLQIYQDDNNDFWFATDGQGVWHLERDGNLTQYSTVNGLAGNRVRDIVEGAEGALWFGTRDGLTRLSDGNFRTFTMKNGLPENKIRDLALGTDGKTLWIATRGGLSRYRNETFKNYNESDGLINRRIQSLTLGENGTLWLGTEEGAGRFENGTFTGYTMEQGLPNNNIHSTLKDRENNIWFGTFGGGISIFLGAHIQNYTTEQGLPNNVISDIIQTRNGDHWITTYGGGIARLRDGEFEILDADDGLVDNKVYTIESDSKNRLLIGTRWGLSIYEDRSFFNYDETELPYRKIRAITELKSQNEVWLGTYGEGVLRLEDNRFTHFSEEDSLANNTVLAAEGTEDGLVWFATNGGLSRYKNGAFTNYTINDGLPNNAVEDILTANDGSLWVSTLGGIARFDNGSFISITAEDGLQDEVCYFIVQDNDDRFWIGTNKGVIRFDYRKYRQANDTIEKQAAFKLITQNQGLVANETNAGAAYKDRQGVLWFGTVNGLTRYDPAGHKRITEPPTVHIENILVSGQSVKNSRNLRIESDERNITFEFVGISFRAPEQVTYQYRLRNSGEDWQQTSRPQVRYSALPAGEYRFEVRARNSDGLWSEERARLSFTVMAPFWMQWWFMLLILLVLIGIFLFIYNYYRIRKMVEIERMRVRIASDLHDDVGSSLTEIALQSDFLQTTNASEDVKDSLQSIGAQSRRIVSSLDDIVWSIDARNDTLGDLTDRMQDYVNNILSNRRLVYHFDNLDMNRTLAVPVKENLYLIFKEAINNVAKHSNATKVEVYLNTDGNSYTLIVDDNGTDVSNKRKTGQGLHNMKMRAKRINASFTFKNDNGFTVEVHGNHA